MSYLYELIKYNEGLPIKAFIHSVKEVELHYHNELEFILVLEGSINLRIGNNIYLLKENDVIIINSNEVHSLYRTKEKNTLLAMQINKEFFDAYTNKYNQIRFDYNFFMDNIKNKNHLDKVRYFLANIVWKINKKSKGYKLLLGSELLLLSAYLINNFDYSFIDEDISESIDKNKDRILRIVKYIEDGTNKKISLQELAENENLSVYYLSRFIKKFIGISFQEYLTIVRLNNAVDLLVNTNKTITQIVYESGFSNIKSFNQSFKSAYGCTPTEYRKEGSNQPTSVQEHNEQKSLSYLDVDRTAAFNKLFTYLISIENNINNQVSNKLNSSKEIIKFDINKKGKTLNPYWKKLITFSRAAEGLRKNWQSQLKEVQKEIGFEYIRFHGIFSDEMMIYNIDSNNNIVYNWTYVDELFDFFIEVNIKPFIELGFMPSEIKKSNETIFWWEANISQPKDIKLWTNLTVEFIKHCINRYGLKEVLSWYFEVWNEPELESVFWIGGKEEYFEFYKQTVLAIKEINEKLVVGGPSISYQNQTKSTWFEDFLIYCNKNNVPLDFISYHIYPESYSLENGIKYLEELAEKGEDVTKVNYFEIAKRIYYDENNTFDVMNAVNNLIKSNLDYLPEVHITEWNASAYDGNLIHDTCYVAAFIIRNIINCIGNVNSLGYWTFTDIMEENKAGISAFHGGFGLINNNGLKKPSYYAYYLLGKLGNEVIEQGHDYIVTKKEDDIQILACNFVYFDELFMNGDTSALSHKERYLIYKEKADKHIKLEIKGLEGKYKLTRYELNRENGSVFDEWIKIGAPENMTFEEIDYLKGRAKPKISIEYLDLAGEYEGSLHILVHGIEAIILEKQL